MDNKTVLEVSVEDIEKRRNPSKHYVYIVRVSWSDGSVQIVYRRYSHFFDLQNQLLDEYPIEAGTRNPADRVIPFLPGKILFGRSHTREVALKRLDPINDYCKALIRLPTRISESHEVLDFFEAKEDDLVPRRENVSVRKGADSGGPVCSISEPEVCDQYIVVAEYKAAGRGGVRGSEVNLRAGEVLDVLEKNDKGWWFVSCEEGQGWVPSSYLEKVDGSDDNRTLKQDTNKEDRPYVCLRDYKPQLNDELELKKGCSVTVLEKNLDGWWLGEFNGKKGRVPACYLSRADTLRGKHLMRKQNPEHPVEIIPNLSDLSSKHSNQRGPPNRNPQATVLHVGSDDNTHQNPSSLKPVLPPSSSSNANKPTPPLSSNKPKFADPSSRSPIPPPAANKPKFGAGKSQTSSQSSSDDDESFPDEEGFRLRRQEGPPPRSGTIRRSVWRGQDGKFTGGTPLKQEEPVYMALSDFSGTQVQGGTSIRRNDVLQVLEKSESGWWYVKTPGQQEGWVPATSVHKAQPSGSTTKKAPPPRPVAPPTASPRTSKKEATQEKATPSAERESGVFADKVGGIKNELANKFSKLLTKVSPGSSPKMSKKSPPQKRLQVSQPVLESSTNKQDGFGIGQKSPGIHGNPSTTSSQFDDFDDDSDADEYMGINDEDLDNVYENVDMSGKPANKTPATRPSYEEAVIVSKDVAQEEEESEEEEEEEYLNIGEEAQKHNPDIRKRKISPPVGSQPSAPKPPSAGLKPSFGVNSQSSGPKPPSAGLKPQSSSATPPSGALKPQSSGPKPPSAALKPQSSIPKPPSAGLKPQSSSPTPPSGALKPQSSGPKPPSTALKPQSSIPKPPSAGLKPQSSSPKPPSTALKPSTSGGPNSNSSAPTGQLSSVLSKFESKQEVSGSAEDNKPAFPVKLKPVSSNKPSVPAAGSKPQASKAVTPPSKLWGAKTKPSAMKPSGGNNAPKFGAGSNKNIVNRNNNGSRNGAVESNGDGEGANVKNIRSMFEK